MTAHQTPTARAARAFDDPQTFDEWQRVYGRREAAYTGRLYDLEELRHHRLFRALDPGGAVIAETRRLTRDIQHVVDVDAAALASTWTIEPAGTGPRIATPSNRPSYSGSALVVALAAPVEVGTKLTAAARPRRHLLAGPSTSPCEAV